MYCQPIARRVLFILLVVCFAFAAHAVSVGAEEREDRPERLRYRGQPLVEIPDADDPIPYEEIIWPWEMRLGDIGWGQARASAYDRMRAWGNDHPGKEVRLSVSTQYGPEARFLATQQNARIIKLTTNDAAVLDQLKFFPEVLELRVTLDVAIDDALEVLRYCPHLTKLEVWSMDHPPVFKRLPISEKSLAAIGTLKRLRFLRFVGIDIADDEFSRLKGMENVLYLEASHLAITSRSFQTIATWPRIRYVKLYGLDFDQVPTEATLDSVDSLVERVDLLITNSGDTEEPETRIHPSLEPHFSKKRADSDGAGDNSR